MSKFSGQQYKGAMRAHREHKRAEAEERNRRSGARTFSDCGHVHGLNSPGRCTP